MTLPLRWTLVVGCVETVDRVMMRPQSLFLGEALEEHQAAHESVQNLQIFHAAGCATNETEFELQTMVACLAAKV